MEPVDIIEGSVSVLWRSDVDTDQIIPKQFLKRIERSGYGEYLFWDWVRSGEIDLQKAPILVAGRNFGCGSSREHAVWALHDFGFRAVIAPSFSDIFHSNAAKNGLLLIELGENECLSVGESGEARIDLPDQTVVSAAGAMSFEYDSKNKQRLLEGLDEISETLLREKEITGWEKDHPLQRRTADIVRAVSS